MTSQWKFGLSHSISFVSYSNVCVMAAPRRSHNVVKLPSLYLSGLTVLPRTRTIVVSPYVPNTAVRSPAEAIQN